MLDEDDLEACGAFIGEVLIWAPFAALIFALGMLGGCASTSDRWVDACQRDYDRNRAAATAAGLLAVWSTTMVLILRGWESQTVPFLA